MSKSKVFFYSCLFFILGVGAGSYLSTPLFASFIIFLAGCVFLFFACPSKQLSVEGDERRRGWPSNHPQPLLGKEGINRRKIFIIVGLGGIFLFLGNFWYAMSAPEINQNQIAFYNGQKITFVGVVSSEPDVRDDGAKLKVKSAARQVKKSGEEWRAVQGNVLVNVRLHPVYRYGDRLEISCGLKKPEPVDEFAYDKYLAKENIYSLCYWPEIKLLARGQGNKLISALLFVKSKFAEVVAKILPEPQAAFLGGLLYGARRSIPEDLMKDFNITGTTHIIAISGYNITIISLMLFSLMKGIGVARKKSFYLSLLGISFFVIITGAQASVVRAAIMGGLALLAQQVGRASKITNALLAAAATMLIFNPKILAFDAGFQLSFAATVGLIFLSPIFERYPAKWSKIFSAKIFRVRHNSLRPETGAISQESSLWKWFKKNIASALFANLTTTMAAIVFTLPLILYNFGRVSFVALLANILILSVIPVTMAVGFVAVLGGLIYTGLGQILGWLAWLCLSYIILIVETLSKIPWASAQVGKIPWAFLAAAYCALGVFIWRQNRGLTRTRPGC